MSAEFDLNGNRRPQELINLINYGLIYVTLDFREGKLVEIYKPIPGTEGAQYLEYATAKLER